MSVPDDKDAQDPVISRVQTWALSLAMVPRTWVSAIRSPDQLLKQYCLSSGLERRQSFTAPVVFALVNAVLAWGVVHAVAGFGSHQGPVWTYQFVLSAFGPLVLGNALLVGLLGALFRLRARSDFVAATGAIGYASVFYPAVSALQYVTEGTLLSPQRIWSALIGGDVMSLVHLTSLQWFALLALAMAVLLWVRSVGTGIRECIVPSISRLRAFLCVLVALSIMGLLHGVEAATRSVPLLRAMLGVSAAVDRLSGLGPSIADIDSYHTIELAAREIAASNLVDPDRRYYAQELAVVFVAARTEALTQARGDVFGFVPTEKSHSGLARRLYEARHEPDRFQQLVGDWARSDRSPAHRTDLGRLSDDDVAELQNLWHLSSASRQDGPWSHEDLHLGLAGLYLGSWFYVFPHPLFGFPRTEYYITVTAKRPGKPDVAFWLPAPKGLGTEKTDASAQAVDQQR